MTQRDLCGYECTQCGRALEVWEIAYLGPRDRADTSCHPFQDFTCTCIDCEEEQHDNQDAVS